MRSCGSDRARRISPATSYPLTKRNSARYDPSCPPIPVISAFGITVARDDTGPAASKQAVKIRPHGTIGAWRSSVSTDGVARLLRRKTKVSAGWLAEQFDLQTCGGMRYGVYKIG